MAVLGSSSVSHASICQLDLASLLERPVIDVLRIVEVAICLRSPVSEVLEATEVLFAWLCTSAFADQDAHAAASRFLREVCLSYPTVALSIISSAGSVQHPKEFIAELPAILSNSPSFVVYECLHELLALSEFPSIAVPVLSAVLGTELSAADRSRVVEATYRALSILSEADFPALFRLIFVNLSVFVGTKVIGKIRSEISSLPIDSVVALLVESLLDTVLYFSPVVNSLLRDALLAADQSQPSIFDVSVALIAFDMSECRESKDRLLLKWLQIGAFPFDKIRDIIQRRSSNEVWNRLVSAVAGLMVWLFEKIADIGSGEKIKKDFISLSEYFYVQNIDRRESWVVYLLTECFRIRGVVSLASFCAETRDFHTDSLSSKIVTRKKGLNRQQTAYLPPLGAAFRPTGVRGRLHYSAVHYASDRSRRGIETYVNRLNLAVDIFGGLIHLRDAGVVAVFHRFLLEKIRPDSYDTSRRNKLCLPPALAMFKILSCYFLADFRREGGGISSTLMITIQKLLCSGLNTIDTELLAVLRLVHASESKFAENRKEVQKRTCGNTSFVDEVVDNSTPQLVGLMMALVFVSNGCDFRTSHPTESAVTVTSAASSSSSSSSSSNVHDRNESNPTQHSDRGNLSITSQQLVVLSWTLQAMSHANDESIIYLCECVSTMLGTALKNQTGQIYVPSQNENNLIKAAEECVKNLTIKFSFIKSLPSRSSSRGRSCQYLFRVREISMELVTAVVRMAPSPSSWARIASTTQSAYWCVLTAGRLIFRLAAMKSHRSGDGDFPNIAFSLRASELSEGLSGLRLNTSSENDDDEVAGESDGLDDVAYYFKRNVPDKSTLMNIRWPDVAGDYVSNEIRSCSDDNIASALQSAWEGALFAGILIAELQSQSSQGNHGTTVEILLRALAAISQARDYLRLSAPYVLDASNNSDEGGMSSGLSGAPDSAHSKNNRSTQRNIGMEMHIKSLQRCLDRLILMIPSSVLCEGMKYLMDPIHSEFKSHDTQPQSLTLLFTVGGVQLISVLCAKVLAGRIPREVSAASQTEPSAYDLIVTAEELCPTWEDAPEDLDEFAIDLAALVPLLMILSENILINGSSDSDYVDGGKSIFGSTVDYPSRCITIASIISIAEYLFGKNESSVGNKITLESWIGRPDIYAILSFRGKIKDSNQLKLFHSYFTRLQFAVCEARDGLVALVGLRLADLLVRPLLDYHLLQQSHQIVAWRIATGIQSSFTTVVSYRYPHMTGIVPVGRGLLWNHLHSYIQSICTFRSHNDPTSTATIRKPKFKQREAIIARREVETRYLRTMWMRWLECATDAILLTWSGVSNALIYIVKFVARCYAESNRVMNSSPQKRRSVADESPQGKKRIRPESARENQNYLSIEENEIGAFFPRLQDDNASDLFDVVLLLMLALIENFEPNKLSMKAIVDEFSAMSQLDKSLVEDPYLSLLLMLSSLLEIIEVISAHIKASIRSNSANIHHENFISIVCSLIARISSIFDKLREAVEKCMTWRSTGSETGDVASIERLLFLMKLTIHFAKNASEIMFQVKQLCLSSSGSDSLNLKRLVRVLPRMSALCDDHIEYIYQTIQKHGIQVSGFSSEDEEKIRALPCLLQLLEQVQRSKLNIVSQLSAEDLLAPKTCASSPVSASLHSNVTEAVETRTVLRKYEAFSSGWGLYTFYDESADEIKNQSPSTIPSKEQDNSNVANKPLASSLPRDPVGPDDRSADSGTETQSDIDEAEENVSFADESLRGYEEDNYYMSEYEEMGNDDADDDDYLDQSMHRTNYNVKYSDEEGNESDIIVDEIHRT